MKYFTKYRFSHVFAMIKNQKKKPSSCSSRCDGLLVVITGATSGIGYECAKKFASMGANLLTINRSEEKSKKLCEELQSTYNIKANYLLADFSSLDDIHSVAKKLATLDESIDILIHNAGIYATKKSFTKDTIEHVFQVNYLSTFIINYYLKEKFLSQNSGKILYVNSEAHRFMPWGIHLDDLGWNKHRYSGLKSYGTAKVAQLLSMLKFNEFFKDSSVTINAMHPGNVLTNSGSNNGKIYKWYKKHFVDKSAIPIEYCAEAVYYLAISKDVQDISGKFFNLTTLEIPAPPALDSIEAQKIWDLSIALGKLS